MCFEISINQDRNKIILVAYIASKLKFLIFNRIYTIFNLLDAINIYF